jgi:hypothetical protein
MKSCAVKTKCQTKDTYYHIEVYNEGKQGLMLTISDDADRDVFISVKDWPNLVNAIYTMISQEDLEEVLTDENF